MAQVLKELSRKPRLRGSKYPMDEWLDGKPRRLSRGKGKDFDCEPKSIGQQLRTVGNQRGLSVSVILFEDAVEVQASARNGQPSKKGKKAKVEK